MVGALIAALILGGCSMSAPTASPAPPVARSTSRAAGITARTTVISLTFDDGNRTQYLVFPYLIDHGMRATFYVNTALIDAADGSVMTWDQLRRLAMAGNDIGGHTLHHADLPTLNDAAKTTEVCADRNRLVAQGFTPVSFAYPFGEHNPASEVIVRSCGYHTARITGPLSRVHPTVSIPPTDPFAIDSFTNGEEGQDNGPLQLTDLQSVVRAAAARGGGWVPIVFHMVCRPSASDYQQCMNSDGPIELSVLTAFINWLSTDSPPGTIVRPINEVGAPQSAAPNAPPAPRARRGSSRTPAVSGHDQRRPPLGFR